MKITAIMGMDVSKKTLDCHLFIQQKSLPPVSNDSKGFKTIKRWLLEGIEDYRRLVGCDGNYSTKFNPYEC